MQIGDNTLGGIVAYLYQEGDTGYISGEEHGFVVSSADIGQTYWGCSGNMNASGIALGTGYQNTLNIINNCPDENTAAKLCVNYNGGGYTDWVLPSNDEALMFCPLNWLGFGNFSTEDICHTSSEVGIEFGDDYVNYLSSFAQNLNYTIDTWNNGEPYWRYFGGNEKTFIFSVRAIRYF